MLDLVIKNGTVVDGTGCEPYKCDIGIKDGKIVRIGDISESASKQIDATGLTVTPGFIDSHSHSDATIILKPDAREKCEQGITTSIAGQCGSSVIPKPNSDNPALHSMTKLKNEVSRIPQGSNIALFVGHGTVRKAVMGLANREPSFDELERMKQLVREAVRSGALGISFGLIYTPSTFAKTDELIELAKVAAEEGGMLAAHIRNEADFVIDAVEEFLTVAKAANARAVISHHKACFKKNHGKVNTTLKLMEEANACGADVYCDVYPYTASSTSMSARFVPKEYTANGKILENLKNPEIREIIKKHNYDRGDCDKIDWTLITNCNGHPEYNGKTVAEIATMMQVDDIEAALKLIEISKNICNACFFSMCEEDVETVIKHPRAMICTDSGIVVNDSPYHPRLRASFPRAISRYVRERKILSLQEMIRKMTSLPASVYNLEDKGLIKEGYDADICIFDFEKLTDKADYTNPHLRAEGLSYVLVSGEIVAENAIYTGCHPGKLILRH